MSRLLECLTKNRLTLIADLAEPNLELAKAAVAGGIDAMQIHLPVDDAAAILRNLVSWPRELKIPIGVMFDGKKAPAEEIVKECLKLGFDFVNFRRDSLPPYYSNIVGLAKVMTLAQSFTMDLVLGIDEHGAQALVAAIVPPGEQGKKLVVGDLQNYISVVLAAGIPVVIPTQVAIQPSEVAIIADTDAKGLLLTPLVLGKTAAHAEKNTREFKVAVDELGN
jgi:hypothetical protein